MTKTGVVDGSIFLVTVGSSQFVTGVVVHTDGEGRAVGAFFGPRIKSPLQASIYKLRLESALFVCRFGEYGLYNKLWPVIGTVPNWAEAPWLVTSFARRHDNPELCYITDYDSRLNRLSERVASAAEGRKLPEDIQYGANNLEKKLAKLIP